MELSWDVDLNLSKKIVDKESSMTAFLYCFFGFSCVMLLQYDFFLKKLLLDLENKVQLILCGNHPKNIKCIAHFFLRG